VNVVQKIADAKAGSSVHQVAVNVPIERFICEQVCNAEVILLHPVDAGQPIKGILKRTNTKRSEAVTGNLSSVFSQGATNALSSHSRGSRLMKVAVSQLKNSRALPKGDCCCNILLQCAQSVT
jgi:hypothetical protein